MTEFVKSIVCVTGNYPDGQKICGAKIVYDRDIDPQSASVDCFEAVGRNIESVAVSGSTVLLELSTKDKTASVIPPPPPFKVKPGGPGGPGDGPKGPPPDLPPTVRLPREVCVKQLTDIKAADGTLIPGSGKKMLSTSAFEPVIEDFIKSEFKGLGYNLYCPKNSAAGEKYPLVVFIHDAGVCGADTRISLSQGNGAITWAKPEWQAEHPCYVLAPQIPKGVKLTNDSFTTSPELGKLKEMIDFIADSYAVDKNRIYATGQSMGCMAFCELNILYPDYFAASMLVAGQWSPERLAANCTGNKFWILVSNHDAKAFPGMNAVTEAMEKAGAKIGRYVWNAKSSAEEFDTFVADALKDDVNIRYTVFEGSSVVPEGQDANPASNHVCTWPVAYEIDGVKRWLFSCTK